MVPFAERRSRSGIGWLTLLIVGVFAVAATDAQATLRVQSHNDPAGDPTPMTYRLNNASWAQPIQFVLNDGEDKSFGPKPGTYTIQAVPPSGWQVRDIQCVGPDPAEFAIDLAHALVTVTHKAADDQTCAFTNGKVNAPPSSGVAPSPPPEELPGNLRKQIALLGVRAGKGFVTVKLRIVHRSAITLHLRRGTRVLARKRIVRHAGVRRVKIRLRPETRRWFRQHGHKRALFTLKIRVAERGDTKKVFWYRVIIRL
jgi:hypothetical protein